MSEHGEAFLVVPFLAKGQRGQFGDERIARFGHIEQERGLFRLLNGDQLFADKSRPMGEDVRSLSRAMLEEICVLRIRKDRRTPEDEWQFVVVVRTVDKYSERRLLRVGDRTVTG